MIFLMMNAPNLNGAHDQDRTGDLILTKDVLYRLSYVGVAILKTLQPVFIKKPGAGNGIRTRDPQLGRLTL